MTARKRKKKKKKKGEQVPPFGKRDTSKFTPYHSEDEAIFEGLRMAGITSDNIGLWAHDEDWQDQSAVNQLDSYDLVTCPLQPEYVHASNIAQVTDLMRIGHKMRGKVIFTVTGFMNDNRGLMRIPAFQKWSKRLFDHAPHWISLAYRDFKDMPYQYFMSLLNPRLVQAVTGYENVAVDIDQLDAIADQSLLKDRFQCAQFGISAIQKDAYNHMLKRWIMNLPTHHQTPPPPFFT